MGKLYINDNLIELPPNFKFARTKQANDIAKGLNNRQANYTQSIKVPKTKQNIKALGYLGALGTLSNAPYLVNNIRYVNESGVDEIYNGTAIIKSTDKYYNLSIYDGYISFFKKIENKVLTDVGISELNHLKSFETITETWNNDLSYRYNIADYNGNTVFDDGINIDYLVPSVKFSFLWQKIHEFAGFTYSGNVFEESFFNNLWITYPKAIGDETRVITDVLVTESERMPQSGGALDINNIVYHNNLLSYFSDVNDSIDTAFIKTEASWLIDNRLNTYRFLNNNTTRIKSNGIYSINVNGLIDAVYVYGRFFNDTEPLPFYGFLSIDISIKLRVLRDGAELVIDLLDIYIGSNFNYTKYVDLLTDDIIYVDIVFSNVNLFDGHVFGRLTSTPFHEGDVLIDVKNVTDTVVDFEEAFIDFSLKKFINEGLFLFSLTPFKDKYTNNIQYLTTDEVINNPDVVDWSAGQGKYIDEVSGKYILTGYAQRSMFKYKYNDSNFDHNDSYLAINNKNIKDETTVVKSNLFSPDAVKSTILNEKYNVYPMWAKEPNEDGVIRYKELSNRFYIMSSKEINSPLRLTSGLTGQVQNVNNYYIESFKGLSFNEIVSKYYQPLKDVLQKSLVLDTNIYLTDSDVANVDFKKPIFIREQGSYFILNKISNYISKGKTKVQLTKVQRTVTASPPPFSKSITANSVVTFEDNKYIIITEVQFVNYIPAEGIFITATRDAQGSTAVYNSYVELNGTGIATHTFEFKTPLGLEYSEDFDIRVSDTINNVDSGDRAVTLPNWFDTTSKFIRLYVDELGETGINTSIQRVFRYLFTNFTPLNAELKVKHVGTNTEYTFALLEKEQDKQNTQLITFNNGAGEYILTILADGFTETQTIFIS